MSLANPTVWIAIHFVSINWIYFRLLEIKNSCHTSVIVIELFTIRSVFIHFSFSILPTNCSSIILHNESSQLRNSNELMPCFRMNERVLEMIFKVILALVSHLATCFSSIRHPLNSSRLTSPIDASSKPRKVESIRIWKYKVQY